MLNGAKFSSDSWDFLAEFKADSKSAEFGKQVPSMHYKMEGKTD